ncbi:hypothetical protein, partial [Bacteroides xylanisolvens]|uniref:hypothetical protein n=1 Tax=Bacteroides xylanisolvens TaxID=371601 RepID=UPI0022E516AD
SSLDWLRFMHTPNDYRVSQLFSRQKSVKLRQKKERGIVLLSIPHTEALPTAYQSRTDNVRAHADMKITTAKRPI